MIKKTDKSVKVKCDNCNEYEENCSIWELPKSVIQIVLAYDSVINSEEADSYNVDYFEYDGSIAEISLPKSCFSKLPYPVKEGSHFWMVVYIYKNELKIALFPVAEYWHESYKED